MKLSQDILFYRLLLSYPVHFSYRNIIDEKYGYPIIYEPGAALSGHVVIIRAEDFDALLGKVKLKGTLFVCIGNNLKKRPHMPSVIIIEEPVSLVSINNYLIKTYDEFEEWDNSLKNVISKGGSFQDLIDCCDSVISDPVAIIDKEFKIVAESDFSKGLDEESELDDDRISPNHFNTLMTESDQRSICSLRDSYILPLSNGRILGRNIMDNEVFVGRIAIHLSSGEDFLQNYYNAILRHFYIYAVKLYHECSSFEVREIPYNRLATLLLHSLHNKRISEKLWEEAFRENGWDKESKFMLVQFIPNSLKGNTIKNIYSKVLKYKADNKWNESLCFIYMEHLLLFINIDKSAGPDKPDLFESLSDFSKKNLLLAGVSRIFCGMKRLRSAYAQTITAIEYGTSNHPSDACYLFDNYALNYMLHSCTGTYESEEVCSGKLMLLSQYDREKGTDYYNTLHTYLICKFNAAEAAKQLFINRSTFHYRLERIQELVHIDFDSEDERLYLAISFKIFEQ